jgi:hypothetical protein
MAGLNLIERATISISQDEIVIVLPSGKAECTPDGLESMIRALEGVRHMVVGNAATQVAQPRIAASPAPASSERAEVRERKRRVEPSPEAFDAVAKKKRRSRKRVGDALVSWMDENPGWHTEEQLLDAVVTNRMTDASPKRALKIALGKQRGDVFDSDGEGHWKLLSDRGAGEAPRPPKTAKKGRGKRTKLAAPGANGRGTRSKRLRVGNVKTSETIETGEKTPASRPLLVKRGQERKSKQAEAPATPAAAGRWGRASATEVDRARKNLLGLGPSSPKVTTGR